MTRSIKPIILSFEPTMPRLVFLILLLIPLSCTRETPKVPQQAAAKKMVQRQAVVGAVTIRIQPFEDIPAAYTQYVVRQLQKQYSKVQVMPPIKFPPRAMNAAGTRYKADSLIRFLHHITPAGSLSMGLTLKDISTNKNGHPDWGIFGLGYCSDATYHVS